MIADRLREFLDNPIVDGIDREIPDGIGGQLGQLDSLLR
jgi:hypothetical protein